MLGESDGERIRHAIVETVVENYDLIARAQEANRRVETVSTTAQAESDKLRESLIKLQAQSKNVMHAGSVWRRRKQVLGSAVAQHQKLLALAEAPALVEECIRGEMYHEALLVMEHMLRSHRYAEQDVSFFVRVNRQIREALERSLDEFVLPRLSGPLSLDASFKIATFLRRLGVSTARMRVLFLERRSLYIDRLVAEAANSPVAYSRILRHINVYKVHVCEVVMQYSACFPTAGTGGAVPAGHGGVDAWDTSLQEWCRQQAERFVTVFAATIRDISNGSELALVVEQCNSCAASVAKLHCDVAPLLNHIIIERVKEVFAGHMGHTLDAYAASMRAFSWRLPPSYTSTTAGSGVGGGAVQQEDAVSTPPLCLAQWLPLAYALNGMLTAFNAVRKCLVPGVEVFCGQHVAALMARICSDLLRDGELVSTMEEGERGVYGDLVATFMETFYPHAILCTRKLLGVEVTRWLEGSLADSMDMLSQRLPSTAAPAEALHSPPPPPQQSDGGVATASHAQPPPSSPPPLPQQPQQPQTQRPVHEPHPGQPQARASALPTDAAPTAAAYRAPATVAPPQPQEPHNVFAAPAPLHSPPEARHPHPQVSAATGAASQNPFALAASGSGELGSQSLLAAPRPSAQPANHNPFGGGTAV